MALVTEDNKVIVSSKNKAFRSFILVELGMKAIDPSIKVAFLPSGETIITDDVLETLEHEGADVFGIYEWVTRDKVMYLGRVRKYDKGGVIENDITNNPFDNDRMKDVVYRANKFINQLRKL